MGLVCTIMRRIDALLKAFAGGVDPSARIGEKKRNAKRAVSQGHWSHSEPIGIYNYMHIIDSKKCSHVHLAVGDF